MPASRLAVERWRTAGKQPRTLSGSRPQGGCRAGDAENILGQVDFSPFALDIVATMCYNVATECRRCLFLKNTVIRFRCTGEEREMIERMARESGRTLTDFLLHLCYLENARYVQASISPDEFAEWLDAEGNLDDIDRKRLAD